MRIAYVLKKFPRLSETFILNEILELERQGVEVTVFSLHKPDDGLFHGSLAQLARPVVYLPVRKGADVARRLTSSLGFLAERREELWSAFEELLRFERPNVWQVIAWGLEVAARARELGIDHMHAHFATVASHVARFAHAAGGTPFSFTCHAKDIYRSTVDRDLFRWLAEGAKSVVTVCDANRRFIDRELLAGNSSADVRVIYNGVDTASFSPEARNESERPLILGIGRLVEKKGFEDLIAATALLEERGVDFECMIVGTGDEREALEAQLAANGTSRTKLLGSRTQEDVRALLGRSAVLAAPCVTGADGNRDALPTVLLEAIASGVPCISTRVSGIPEILDEGAAGLLVDEHDPEGLAAALEQTLADSDLRAKLARAGRSRAEELFDLRRNVAKLSGVFANGTGPKE